MTRALAWLAIGAAAVTATVFFLVKMGAPGWFTLTIALAFAAATVLIAWPVILAAGVAWVLWKVVQYRARRAGGRSWS